MEFVLILVISALILINTSVFIRYRQIKRSHIGKMVIIPQEDGKMLFSLELEKEPDEFVRMPFVYFNVTHSSSEDAE